MIYIIKTLKPEIISIKKINVLSKKIYNELFKVNQFYHSSNNNIGN